MGYAHIVAPEVLLPAPLNDPRDDAIPVAPASRPFPQDIHRHRRQYNRSRDPANDKETISHALVEDPIVGVESQPKSEKVLDKIHDGKGLGGLLAVAVNDVGDDAGGAQLDAEVDEAQTNNDGNRPGILGVEGLAPGEEAGCSEEEVSRHDGESKFGF